MADQCPTCERTFESMNDYPLIRIVRFTRIPISDSQTFPLHDWTHFRDSRDYSLMGVHYPKVPAEVEEFFRKNPKAPAFEYQGWQWSLAGAWENGSYTRAQGDLRRAITAGLDPYFSTLERLAGSIVPTRDVYPPFERTSVSTFNIPGIPEDHGTPEYQLAFDTEKRTPAGTVKKLDLYLFYVRPNSEFINRVATVGNLEYEGKYK